MILALVLAPIMALALAEANPRARAFAQIGGPPAPPVSPLAPAPQLPRALPQGPAIQPLATPAPQSALPSLAPGPRVVQPLATPTPQAFRCSCYGTGSSTQWVGTVQASNAVQASQSAAGQCIGILASRSPGSPLIRPPEFGFSRSPFPQVGPGTTPGDVFNPTAGVTLPSGVLTAPTQRIGLGLARARAFGPTTGRQICGHCACN